MRIGLADGTVSAEVTGTAEAAGSGPCVVLLHSLLADAGSFAPLAALLAPDWQVVLPDLPGFGGSAPVAGGLPAVADRMAQAIHGLNLPAPPVVIGNGYGSFLALVLALRHPGVACRLVLAGCGAAFSEPGRAQFRGMAAAAGAKGLAAIADTAMRRLFSPDFQAANPGLTAQRRAAFLATDMDMFLTACADLATLDITAEMPRLTMPVLCLAGAEDEATPAAMAEQLAGLLPDARFVLLPDCAHVPQLQDPKRFLAAIQGFLTAVPAQG